MAPGKRNFGKGSGRGGVNRARPGHGHATPSDDPRPQQRNREAAELAIHQAAGESGGQQGNSSTINTGSQASGGRGASTAPRGRSSGGNQGRPHTGSGWGSRKHQTGNQARGSRNPPLALVAKSSQSQVADLAGAVASRLVNNSLEGGNTHHWYSARPGDRIWGETRGGGVDEVIEDVMRRSGATSVQFHVIPNVEGRFETVSANAVERTWEDNNAHNDKGKPAGVLRHGVNMDPETKKPTKCAACGSKSHKLATCISRPARQDGAQVGCPLCDTIQHHGGDCEAIAALSLPEQVKLLISGRASMPPFRGKTQPWWKLLHNYCMSEQFVQGTVTGLPWSKEFITSVAKRILPMQTRLDTVPGYKLPVDEDTANAGPIYWKYWVPNNLVWPPVLGQIPPCPAHMMDTDGTAATGSAPAPQTVAATDAAAPAPAPAPGPAPGPAPPSPPATSSVAAGGLDFGLPPNAASDVGFGLITTLGAGQDLPASSIGSGHATPPDAGQKEDEKEEDGEDLIGYSDDDQMH
ncbi:hypothetical protein FOBRF1_011925 [Fusarium oxysporum]